MFADGIDLVGDEAVSFPMDGVGGLGIVRLDQAEYFSCLLIHPVPQIAHPISGLGLEVLSVSLGHIGDDTPPSML